MSATESVCGNLSVTKANFKWEIDKCYLTYKGVGEYLTSPIFYALNATWQIILFPSGVDEECKDHLSIFLQLLNFAKPVETVISITMLNISGADYAKSIKSLKMISTTERICLSNRFITYTDLIDYINFSGSLTLTCDFSPEPNTRLLGPLDFGNALNNQQYSDVKFLVEGKTIYAHKIVLANKSKVFAAMFEHQMKENIDNVVEIEDVEYGVLLELLRYIYTGIVNGMEKIAESLLVAADKYDLVNLKAECIEHLVEKVTMDNVKESLDLAETYDVESLKMKAINFIISNASEMSNTPSFKVIVESHPDAVVKVVRGLSENKYA